MVGTRAFADVLAAFRVVVAAMGAGLVTALALDKRKKVAAPPLDLPAERDERDALACGVRLRNAAVLAA